jgi:hypothetical protein
VTKEKNELLLDNANLLQLNEELVSLIHKLKVELHKMRTEKAAQSKYSFLEEIKTDDKMTLFYTGLNNFKLFSGIFQSLKPALQSDPRFALTLEEQFLVTLMKLRLNL